jgi:hypothetical protein
MVWLNQQSVQLKKNKEEIRSAQVAKGISRLSSSRCNITEKMETLLFRGATGSDETWPAEQPPLAVFPDCTRRYWVDMLSAHRIPQLHFQLS